MEELKSVPFNELVAMAGGSVDSDVGASYSDPDIQVPGVGYVHLRWLVQPIPGETQIVYVAVQAEGTGVLSGERSRARFTTFRSCTGLKAGCPTR
jgi:hypothetical protein